MNFKKEKPLVATEKLYYGVFILCEDEKSNYKYLEAKKAACRPNTESVKIDFYLQNSVDAGGRTDTYGLVQYAIAEVERLNKKIADGNVELENFFKKVYCVCDVDDNETRSQRFGITRAFAELEKAKTANPSIDFHLLLSNECFEIWYILHFQDITEPLYRGTKPQLDTVGLIKPDKSNLIRKQLGLSAGISVREELQKQRSDFFDIMQEKGNELQAIQRAKNLAATKNPTDKFAKNPSTDVYILIEMLNNLR